MHKQAAGGPTQTASEQTSQRCFADNMLHALVEGSACSKAAVEQHVTAEEEQRTGKAGQPGESMSCAVACHACGVGGLTRRS